MIARRPKRRRIVATVAALAVAAGLLSTPFGDTATAGPAELDTGIECPLGAGATAHLPMWACPSPAAGHFWAWFLAPNGPWPPGMAFPAGRPARPTLIGTDGVVGSADNLDAVLWWITAVGSRGQAPYTAPADWVFQDALFPVGRARNGEAGKTALEFLREKVKAACPDSVYLKARVGYVAYAMGEDPRAVAACDLVDGVQKSLNITTGQYGTGIKDTVWSVYLLNAYAAEIGQRTQSYLIDTARNDGGWAADGSKTGALDIETTARVVMALTALGMQGADPVFEKAIAALVAVQNDDTGFGEPSSTSVSTSQVYGTLNDLAEAGKDYFPEFKSSTNVPGVPAVKNARFQMGWFQQVIMLDQCTNSPTEGRFYTSMAERVAKVGPDATPNCVAPDAAAASTPPVAADVAADVTTQSTVMFFAYFSDPVRGQAAPAEPVPTPDPPETPVVVEPTVTG